MSRRALSSVVSLCVVAALLAWAAAPVVASMAEKGSISGRVLMSDGKPAQLTLRLEQTVPMGMDKGDRKPRSTGPDTGATQLQGGERQGNVKVIARVTTDKEGKFTIPNLEQGAYTLVGGSRSLGWIYYPVEVEAGKETKLGDITLTKT